MSAGSRTGCASTVGHKALRRLACLTLLFGLSFSLVAQAGGSGGVNAPGQQHKPYLVLVSLDGFRWDYPARFSTPALDRLAAGGVRAKSLVPVFPTLTFPNHYSIATGLYPAAHGLLGNRFYSADRSRFYSMRDRTSVEDGSWYKGTPIWVAAEQAGMVSAAFFWVGTEAPVDGVRPTHWRRYDGAVPPAERVAQVLDWLRLPAAQRPHMLSLYFDDVDRASHRHGIDSPETRAAVKQVDSYLAELMAGIESLPVADEVYLLVVSDHGQADYQPGHTTFLLDSVVELDGLEVVDHGSVAFVYFRQPDPARARSMREAINGAWRHGRALLPADAPASWRLGSADGYADLIVLAEPGYSVRSSAPDRPYRNRGDHGWAPEVEAMHGVFLARGPRLPAGRLVPAVRAVDIYPLMEAILELPGTTATDGDPLLLPGLLQAR